MRTLTLAALLAVFSTLTGCATGARVGGDRFGAGVGGYIGRTPEAVAHPVPSYTVPAIPSH